MLANNIHTNTSTAPSDHPHHSFPSSENGAPPPLAPTTHKRKRRPAGTPDPDAEVVSLSPKTLLESNRYVCEICNQGFQRDQNLQMHRRRHKVPWKLLKRKAHDQLKKRVYVCPERSCLHHDPSHALGDLIGIKKHFRRKHSIHKQWVCDKCSKGYAVQSDYKAHLKTCGTRGHSCDCGRVFSRVESFIEHQDTCSVRHVVRPELQQALQPAVASSSRTASNTASPSSDGHFSINNNNAPPALMPKLPFMPKPNEQQRHVVLMNTHEGHDGYNPSTSGHHKQEHFLELQLLPSSAAHENYATHLNLSIGGALRGGGGDRKMELVNTNIGIGGGSISSRSSEELKLAMLEKAYAEEARREVRRQVETAEADLARAKRMREEAQAQLRKAQLLKEQSGRTVSSAIMQITCPSCKQQFHLAAAVGPSSERTRTATSSSVVMSYMSSATAESKEKDAKQ